MKAHFRAFSAEDARQSLIERLNGRFVEFDTLVVTDRDRLLPSRHGSYSVIWYVQLTERETGRIFGLQCVRLAAAKPFEYCAVLDDERCSRPVGALCSAVDVLVTAVSNPARIETAEPMRMAG